MGPLHARVTHSRPRVSLEAAPRLCHENRSWSDGGQGAQAAHRLPRSAAAADRHHRTFRVTNHLLGDAAENESAYAGLAVCPHDDEVGADLVRGIEQDARDIAGLNQHLGMGLDVVTIGSFAHFPFELTDLACIWGDELQRDVGCSQWM